MKVKEIKNKQDLTDFIYNLFDRRKKEKPNKHFAYKILNREQIYERFVNRTPWKGLSKEEKRKKIRNIIREALRFYLEAKNLIDKTYQNPKTKDYNKVTVVDSKKAKIILKWIPGVGVHPSPEDFRPRLKEKRNKNVYFVMVFDEDKYESSKHTNILRIDAYETKETERGVVVFIKYFLYRRALDFGRHKTFGFIFGVDDGSFFVDRVSPKVNSVEKALEWLKPAEVRKAEEEGRKVFRQGDVFFVELKTKKKTIFDYELPKNHIPLLKDGKIIIKHHEHSFLELPHPHFKPIVRKTIVGTVSRIAD